MKSATIRDFERVQVGDTVGFWIVNQQPTRGVVVEIYRDNEHYYPSGYRPTMLVVQYGEYQQKVPASQAWKWKDD